MRSRALLPAAAAAVFAAPAVFLTATVAVAHGDTLNVDITGHEHGHVETVVTWENDNDPVDERVAATVNAESSDGRTAGPWKLVRDTGTATGYTTAEALPPGRWTVTVEAGYPGLSRDQAEITVSPGTPASPSAAAASPAASTPASPGAASTPTSSSAASSPAESESADPAARADGAGPGTVGSTVMVAVGILLACAAGIVIARGIRRVRT